MGLRTNGNIVGLSARAGGILGATMESQRCINNG
jgi:hypothetical protein